MKKYKTLLLLLILCMVVCIFAGTTYAWFVKVKRTGAVYFKTGEVEYSIDYNEFENNFANFFFFSMSWEIDCFEKYKEK